MLTPKSAYINYLYTMLEEDETNASCEAIEHHITRPIIFYKNYKNRFSSPKKVW
jgi:hypothetical protein